MSRSTKRTKIASAIICALVLFSGAAFGQQSGATLQASKTIDICLLPEGNWRYSGVVSLWNQGPTETQGLRISDCIENKGSGPNFTARYCGVLTEGGLATIPGYWPEETAITFPYIFDGAPLGGTIRNNAVVTITNHSGWLPGGRNCPGPAPCPFGPNPKATYRGPIPPPPCGQVEGCAYTQGYWKSKPGVVWPNPYSRGDFFFTSGQTWQQVFDTEPRGNGYYILAHQYMAAVLNQANGAGVPSGVGGILELASEWFWSNSPSACPRGEDCGLQKTWAEILDDYNNGVYPGGPPHCDDEDDEPE